MPITRLVAEDFRNLRSVDIQPGAKLNLLSGLNGSGKTSVLEVIYTLATGRSFRTRKFKNLIAYHKAGFQLFAEVGLGGERHRLGISRMADGTSLFKLNGEHVSSAGELAVLMPCQVLNSQSFELLQGGPTERRAFIDWLVFHVKPRFRQAWGEYNRCLKQRNAMLRSSTAPSSEFGAWDSTLAALGEEIDAYRQELIFELLPVSSGYLALCEFIENGEFEMRYVPGWDHSRTLLEELKSHRERDIVLGHTSVGPHKADIRFIFNRKPLVELFSRGQQKAVVAALYLSQLRVLHNSSTKGCILLLDDLPAELDAENLQRLCNWIRELADVQVFVTGIDLTPISNIWPVTGTGESEKMFHVKHGQIKNNNVSGANHD